MTDIDLAQEIRGYLQAIEDRDLDRCLALYTDDPTIRFATGTYHGKQAATEWHKDRFKANVHVKLMDDIAVQGDQVVINAVVTSDRLKAWRINTLKGKGTFQFENGKVKEARFALTGANPLEGWAQ